MMNQIGETPNLIGNGIENYLEPTQKLDKERMEAAGKDFEGVFLSMMLKEMRNTLENGGFFGEESSDTYGGMFDLFIGQSLAKSSPLGIGELVINDYLKNQPKTQSKDSPTQTPEISAQE